MIKDLIFFIFFVKFHFKDIKKKKIYIMYQKSELNLSLNTRSVASFLRVRTLLVSLLKHIFL